MTSTDTFVRASDAALKFALDLSNQLGKGWNAEKLREVSKPEVAALIKSYLKEREDMRSVAAALRGAPVTPDKRFTAPPNLVEPGFYIKDGDVFQVVNNQAKTNRYAKILTTNGRFEYATGVIFLLTPEHALTAEQAKEYYTKTGNCIFCRREITRESSKSVGYGPVCAEKYSLPHPDNA